MTIVEANKLLRIQNLRVSFDTADGRIQAVRGIDLDVGAGECVGIVGESGSGKSQAMHSSHGSSGGQWQGGRIGSF